MNSQTELPPEKYRITKKEAAARLGVAAMTIDRAITRGKLTKYPLENGYNVVLDIREVDCLPVLRVTVGPQH